MPKKNEFSVVYVKENRELVTRTDFFKEIQKSVIGIEWEEGIKGGCNIKSGQLLGEIIWDGIAKTPICAPPGCTGCIEFKNGRILYEWLHKKSYLLLRLQKN